MRDDALRRRLDGARARPIWSTARHAQYAGKLDEETQFRIVAAAHGRSGANRDYVINTAAHLAELGMPDAADAGPAGASACVRVDPAALRGPSI